MFLLNLLIAVSAMATSERGARSDYELIRAVSENKLIY